MNKKRFIIPVNESNCGYVNILIDILGSIATDFFIEVGEWLYYKMLSLYDGNNKKLALKHKNHLSPDTFLGAEMYVNVGLIQNELVICTNWVD